MDEKLLLKLLFNRKAIIRDEEDEDPAWRKGL
jgi:hypothetical protein